MNHFRIVIEKSKLAAKPDYFLNDIMMDIATICDEDSLFIRQDGNAVLFMGLCFNKRKVLAQNNATEWVSLASRRLIDSPKAFLAQLDGSFCGFLYKGSDHSLILFSDHLASQPIYFYIDDKHCIIDTNLILLADAMRHYHKPIKVSELGGYYMLAYSFMLDDITPINGVYKVKPSTLFSVDNQQLIEYCQFYQEDKIIDCRIEDIADSIHDRFSEAVKSTFAIDGKHRHLISLSGGLDSRMCLFYAINQGATDISTLCYSQSFYREEVIAKKISAEHNCEHIFFGLDNGKYLSNIDTGIIATQGMTTYRPILSARMIWEKLRMDRFGLVHTGLLGDAIIGGYCIGKCGQSDRFISALDFAFQLNPKNKSLLHAKYKNEILPFLDDILDWIPSDKLLSLKSEKFILENRYFNGLVQSYLGLRDISIVSSPFVSRELMQYIFAFPSKIRLNHELYFKWMERHMPVAMQYRWENTGLHPAYGNMQIKPDSQIVKNLKRIDEIFNKGKPERSRNPYQYWIKNNEQIMDEVINYCTYRISLIEDSPRLYQFIKTILSHDNIYLCIRAATLLGLLSLCYRYE